MTSCQYPDFDIQLESWSQEPQEIQIELQLIAKDRIFQTPLNYNPYLLVTFVAI